MIIWNNVGSHCGRMIYLGRAITIGEYHFDSSISSSILLVYFGNIPCNDKWIEELFRNLFLKNPLSISLAGVKSSEYFDLLLEMLSIWPTDRHIMTRRSREIDITEWISDFLMGTFPSEDRFDEWYSYRILVIGSISLYQYILGEIKSNFSEG